MVLTLEVVPLHLYSSVGLELWIALGIAYPILLEDGDEVIEEQGIDPLVLILRDDPDEVEVYDGVLHLQCTQ